MKLSKNKDGYYDLDVRKYEGPTSTYPMPLRS